jgi:hypothetical protein
MTGKAVPHLYVARCGCRRLFCACSARRTPRRCTAASTRRASACAAPGELTQHNAGIHF